MMTLKDKFIQFYTKNDNENIKKKIFIILNTINLLFFINTKLVVPITVLIFILYFSCSTILHKKKKKILLTWITFSLTTLLGEAIVINSTTNTLKYYNTDFLNVPIWLFSAYASMIMSIVLYMDFYDEFS